MKVNPIATYRVQLTGDFGLAAAAELVPYLARLGISHLYTSPSLQATSGSTSGYDVVDPTRVSDELGGQTAHDQLSAALAEQGMGRMVDIVPNHMAISGSDNPWWQDVLKNGRASRYAAWFDVDWAASEELWPNRVLLPVLGDQFGRVLEAGDLRLAHRECQFTIVYYDNEFPVEPSSTGPILKRVAEEHGHRALGFLADSLSRLPRPTASLDSSIERRHRDQRVLAELLARLCREEPALTAAIDAEVNRINTHLCELGALIEKQNYRLAHWRAADLDLGYRRFFNINDLAGLRVEIPEVFSAVHALPLRWLREGEAHALRVDHPDGLRDPTEYFQRLRAAGPGAWIVAEKILEPGEKLPEEWPIDGTTGYDFANLVQGLFIDPAGEEPLSQCYAQFTGRDSDYEAVVRAAKRSVLNDLLGSEIDRVTTLLRNICEQHWRHRDHTRAVLSEVVVEVAVHFQVYRTYVRPGREVSQFDRTCIHEAVTAAREANPELDAELLDFFQKLLLLEIEGDLEAEFALRFQQLTGPAMAKGLEDTTFYRYFRFTALNEVGGNPGGWGIPVRDFHAACEEAATARPFSMLATSTHDTKRSEDVRARLLVLSEIPDAWAETSQHWHELNADRRGNKVDANTEYLFYQTLIGAWPIDVNRITDYMVKAVREGKEHSDWTRVDEAYEADLHHFIESTLAAQPFIKELEEFVRRITRPGQINSLAQTLLKLTAPGVPDIYQGCELWDYSLVDPDNRRPVDFAARIRLLDELDRLTPSAIMERLDEGLPKMWLIREALRLRREFPDCFGAGASYEPLSIRGEKAEHVVAFCRAGNVIAVVPRLITKLNDDWANTRLALPAGTWRNQLSYDDCFQGGVSLDELLATVPVALLTKEI